MKTVSVSPHIHSNNSIQKSMLLVSAALLPAAAWGVYSFGLRALIVLLVSIISCLLTEFLLGLINKEKTLSDGSALVTGLLIGMNMPSTVPLYVPIIASIFAIAVVKWTFGGLGCNWMNPALAGRVFVFFSFTTLMSTFALPHALETNYVIPGRDNTTIEAPADSVSAATLTTAESNGKGGMIIIANKFIQVDFPEGIAQNDISRWADAVIAKYPTIFDGYKYFFNKSGLLEFEAPNKINDLYHVGLISIIRTEIANYVDNLAVDSVSAATKISGTKYRANGFDGAITIANRYVMVSYPIDQFSLDDMAKWADGVIKKYPELFEGGKHFAAKGGGYEFAVPERINDNLHEMYSSVIKNEIISLVGGDLEKEVDAVSSATKQTFASSGFGGSIAIANKYITVDYNTSEISQAEMSAWADEIISNNKLLFNGVTYFFNDKNIEFVFPSKINDNYHDGFVAFFQGELGSLMKEDIVLVDAVSSATKITGVEYKAGDFSGATSIANKFITVDYPTNKISTDEMASWADSIIAKYPDLFRGAKHFAGATYYEFELPEKINDNLHDLINSVLSSEVSAFIVENSSVDTVSSATMLSANKTALVGGAKGNMESVLSSVNVPVTPFASALGEKLGISPYTIDSFFGNQSGCIGEVSALLLIIGGIFLIVMGVITWHIPVVYIGSFALLSWIFGGIPAGNGLFHGEILTPLFTGGLMLGAFFMATDWVTTPTTTLGQVIFAIGCGFFTFLFRYFGSLPEGTSLAIILMNIVNPTIDRYIKPKKFGFVKAKKEKK